MNRLSLEDAFLFSIIKWSYLANGKNPNAFEPIKHLGKTDCGLCEYYKRKCKRCPLSKEFLIRDSTLHILCKASSNKTASYCDYWNFVSLWEGSDSEAAKRYATRIRDKIILIAEKWWMKKMGNSVRISHITSEMLKTAFVQGAQWQSGKPYGEDEDDYISEIEEAETRELSGTLGIKEKV